MPVAARMPVQVRSTPGVAQAAGSLKISSPADPAEREAEQTATRIMRMPLAQSVNTITAKHSPHAARFANTIRQHEPARIARKQEGAASTSAGVASGIGASQSSGVQLPSGVRQFMEPRFSADFSRVRIHTGEQAANLNRQVSAQAFTVGNQIYFGRDRYQPESSQGRELIAHELTHTIQQGAAVQRAAEVSVTQQSPVQAQRSWFPNPLSLLPNPLNYIADKANLIPGFRMFTIVLGVNPINMSGVDRSPANILRALIEFIPGGGLITQALDNHGVFDKVGKWVAQQIATLGMVGSSIKQAVTQFIASLSVSDLGNLGGAWERAKRIFTEPIDRIINFAKGLVTDIVTFIKDAILMPLARLAEGTRGWDLLCAVLGKNPITGAAVPRTAETLIGGFMKLIGQDEVWENMKKANAIPRAWAWFQGAMAALMGFVAQIPALAVNAFKSLVLMDIILVPRAFMKVAAVFGDFIGKFFTWAGNAVWTLLEIIFDSLKPGIMGYVKRTGAALKSILKNPLPFVGNLVKAAKLGFQNFADNFGGHLKAGLIDWLTGSLSGVYIPKALSLVELGKFAMSVLGITWAQIRGKIVKVLGPSGETIMKGLETGFDIVVALVTGGPAAAWELIKEKLTELKDQVISGIVGFVTETVIKKAVPKLISMFIPGAGFISAIISIYDTVMVFVQKISKIIQVVVAFIDSIVAIAGGNISAAAKRVENILGGLLSLAISFLAGFLGLGKVTDKIMGVIEKVRASVDKAIDAAINWIVTKAKALFGKLFGKDKKDERTPEQKQADLNKALKEAEALQKKPKITEADIRKGLPLIKSRYKMVSLELVVDNKSGDKETVHAKGKINPEGDSAPTDVELEPDGDMVPFKIPRPADFTAETAKYLNPDDLKLKEAKLDRRHIISSKDMAEHYETVLVKQLKWSKAKELLEKKSENVGKPLSNEAIATTAKNRHYKFFNDKQNLFLGPRGKNRSLGRRVDMGSDLLVPLLTEEGFQEHLKYVNEKWALDGSFQPTPS